ncbi:MAG: hypothetical protein OXB98_15020 [Bryobacterales bacterium]|nr:hypothetical protein [Bryobacterales bacterium]
MRPKARTRLWLRTVVALVLAEVGLLSAQEIVTPAPLVELSGHRDVVRFLRYLPPDGRNILSLSGELLTIWDSRTGEEIIRLVDGERIYTLAVSDAGDRAYVETLSANRILDISTTEVLLEFDLSQRFRLRGPVWSPMGTRIATQERGAVHVWDASSGGLLRSFEGLPTTVYPYGVRWSPEGTRLAVLQLDGALKVWRVDDGEEISAFQAHDPVPGLGARPLAWSPDGSRLATAANDSLVKLWDTREWKLVHALTNESNLRFGSGSPIDRIAFSPDGNRIAVAQPSTLRVWDVESGQQVVEWYPAPENTAFVPHNGSITDMVFSPDGRYLASAGLDRTAKVWDVETGTQLLDLDIFLNSVEAVEWSPNGSQFAVAGDDGRVIVWDRATDREVARFEGHRQGAVLSLDFAPDGTHVVTSGRDGSVRVWDAGSGMQLYELPERVEPLSRLRPPRRPVGRVSYSPRGERFLTISDSLSFNVVELWDHAAQGGAGITLDFQVNSAAWSPDGRRIASARYSFITVWDLDDIQSRPLEFYPDSGASDTEYKYVAWSHDGEHLLIASNNGATVLDWASNETLLSLTPERGAAYLEESSDGSLLLTIDGQFRGPRVQVWNAETGLELVSLATVGSQVGAEFSPDGKRLLTYGRQDLAVRVWDALTGEESLTLTGQRAPFSHAAFSQDGLRLAGASRDGTIWMWDALTGDLLTMIPGGGLGIVFSPDETRIAGFGSAGAALWSVGPRFSTDGVVNAASFASGPVAPGEIIGIFGAGLGPETPARGAVDPETGRLPVALEKVSVLLDGEPVPLLFVQGEQIYAQVPYEIAGRSEVQLAISYGGIVSPRTTLAVSPARPALFLMASSRSAFVLNEGGQFNSASQPARLGESVILFGTGQGETSPPIGTGQTTPEIGAHRIEDVSVTVGGSAAEVISAGMVPSLVGVFLIQVRIPDTAATGTRTPVSVTIQGESSPKDVVMSVASP